MGGRSFGKRWARWALGRELQCSCRGRGQCAGAPAPSLRLPPALLWHPKVYFSSSRLGLGSSWPGSASLAAQLPAVRADKGRVHLALDINPGLCLHFSAIVGCLKSTLTPGLTALIGMVSKGRLFNRIETKKGKITRYNGFLWHFSWCFLPEVHMMLCPTTEVLETS